MSLDRSRHPCFNKDARHAFGRVHLPVAPKCNIQCNYCNRKYACANENRPGVSTRVLSPGQALYYLKQVMARETNVSVVGIAGPGDAFATPDTTLETLRLVRKEYPSMLSCVATNGLHLAPFIPDLAALQTSHVTITINCVDADIGAPIYAWARDGKVIYRGRQAAEVLIERQLSAIRELKQANIVVKINSILMPGINDRHMEEIAHTVKAQGADIMNCIPLLPVEDTPFGNLAEPSKDLVSQARATCGDILPQMEHCTRCRADAAGLLGNENDTPSKSLLQQAAEQPLNPAEERPYIAVASLEGVLVNQHLGEANSFFIFNQVEDGYQLMETRPAPPAGGGSTRWNRLADTLRDCQALLVASAGKSPYEVLTNRGIRIVMMEGLIEEGLHAVYGGQEIRAPLRCEHRCGSGCAGTGTGCM